MSPVGHYPRTKEHSQKISLALTGKVASGRTRLKMSESAKARHAREREESYWAEMDWNSVPGCVPNLQLDCEYK